MSNDEDENHVIAEIVREMLSGNKYDTKTIPKRYIPKIQAVLKAAKQDAITRGQLPVVKQLQAILATLPDTDIVYNGQTNSLLDQKNKKRTIQPTSQIKSRRIYQYKSKDSSPNTEKPISNSRLYRPKTALQYKNRNNTKQDTNSNKENNEFVSIDFDSDFEEHKANRLVYSSPPEKILSIQKNHPKKRLYTDEQLDVALENMVSGNSFIPQSDVLPELIDYTKRKINSLIENGELIVAQKYENVYQQLQSSKLSWQDCSMKTAKLQELTIHLNKTDKNLQNAQERMEIELREYDKEMKIIREAQIDEFEQNLIEFDKETNFRIIEKDDDENSQSNQSTSRNSTDQSTSQNTQDSENSTDQSNSQNSQNTQKSEISIDQSNSEISSISKISISQQNYKNKTNSLLSTNRSAQNKSKIYPNLPPSFRKFSQRLLDLRQKEKILLKTRRFEEAGYTRIEADNIEAYELQQCKNNYLRSREDKRAKLIEDHNQKMKCFDENTARTRQRLQSENEVRISALKKAKENFQNRIERLDGEIKDALSITPVPSPSTLQSKPLSPHRSPDSYQSPTFMTQHQQTIEKNKKNDSKNDQKPNKKRSTTSMASPQIVYRPIPSKWRLQTPVVLKVHK